MKPLLVLLLVVLLAGRSSPAAEPSAAPAPIDVSRWKLTLPIDAAGTVDGKASEVLPAELTAGYQHPDYFVAAGDGSLTFWCPVDGATTEGTEYPRTELREMLDPRNPRVNWSPVGTHAMSARCQVRDVPSSQKVIIGQIHSYSGKARPLIKLQFYKGRIEALVKVSPTRGEDRKLVFPEVGLNADIDYEIRLQDGQLDVTVNDTTQTEQIFENDPEWANQTFYFKAGAYPQDNEGPPTEGARIVFTQLTVVHSKTANEATNGPRAAP